MVGGSYIQEKEGARKTYQVVYTHLENCRDCKVEFERLGSGGTGD